jgi:hypothetical protein
MERFITEQGEKLVIMKRKETYIKKYWEVEKVLRVVGVRWEIKKVPPCVHLKTPCPVYTRWDNEKFMFLTF